MAGISVLVVDHHAACREMLQELLQEAQARAVCVSDGGEALRELEGSKRFDIVLIGARLPDMPCEELGRRIRALPQAGEVPLILVAPISDRRVIVDPPFAGYLAKPVRRTHLARIVNAALGVSAADYPAVERTSVRKHPGKRVLLAEDNAVNQKVAVRLLEKHDIAVDVVSNGVAAVDAAVRGPYDLILMDCEMPQMDGFAATREIRRQQQGLRRTPILAMTASAIRGDRERCLAAGMDDYLTKPIDLQTLAGVLDRWMRPGEYLG